MSSKQSVLNMITVINELKTSTKHMSWECKCKFDRKNVIQIIGEIMINVSVEKMMYVKKIKFGTLRPVVVKMENI